MQLKQIINVKNIFLWIAGITTIAFACYILFYPFTLKFAYSNAPDGNLAVEAVFPGVALGSGKISMDGVAGVVKGQSFAWGSPLYLIGAILIVAAGILEIGSTFLFMLRKKGLILLLCLLLFIGGFVLWWIGESPVFGLFENGGRFANLFGTAMNGLQLEDGYTGLSYVGLELDTYFFNQAPFWIINMIGFPSLLIGMVIRAPKAK